VKRCTPPRRRGRQEHLYRAAEIADCRSQIAEVRTLNPLQKSEVRSKKAEVKTGIARGRGHEAESSGFGAAELVVSILRLRSGQALRLLHPSKQKRLAGEPGALGTGSFAKSREG